MWKFYIFYAFAWGTAVATDFMFSRRASRSHEWDVSLTPSWKLFRSYSNFLLEWNWLGFSEVKGHGCSDLAFFWMTPTVSERPRQNFFLHLPKNKLLFDPRMNWLYFVRFNWPLTFNQQILALVTFHEFIHSLWHSLTASPILVLPGRVVLSRTTWLHMFPVQHAHEIYL